MHVASAFVLAVAVLTSSATATSLDVEPVETSAPLLRGSNSSTNATSDSKISIQRSCGVMWSENWDNVKYACEWTHSRFFGRYYNLFFMRFDGSVVKECDCSKGLWLYAPWGSRWTLSFADSVACYTRDAKPATEATRTEETNLFYKSQKPSLEQLKRLCHFARCMHSALIEFATTDKASDEEKELYDPESWGIESYSQEGWLVGYNDSIIKGYIQLNLILVDPKAFVPMLADCYGRATEEIRAMLDNRDGEHPDWLAHHLQQAFDGDVLKPLTPDVQQILRDHCAKLFRCMYSLLAPRGEVTPVFIARKIAVCFGFAYEIWDELEELAKAS